ncbi:SDR family oxidoreductase [Myxococcota bacterium]|nr:SDR family oxidoreductase [Myxococcota bacterium]
MSKRNPAIGVVPGLEGRVAIVTGAASGIGLASARALAAAGARVVIADLNGEGARRVASEIGGAGGTAIAVEVDVGNEGEVRAMVEAAVESFGGLDILHNNAAEVSADIMGRDLEIDQMDTDVWDRVMVVNLRGPMLGCKYAIRAMLEGGRGSIIHTSSASALTGDLGRPAYAASKEGLHSLTRNVATQYGKRGIRCNAIAPGVIETPALARNVPQEQIDAYLSHHLTPRLGRPEDIADAVVFLASDQSAFITGQVLCVDGGLLSHHPTFAQFATGAGTG